MKKKLLITTPVLGASALFALAHAAQQDKPNVIYILMDDMGYAEAGCYGQKFIETPNIDALASKGVRFTQNYAGSGVSAPSRCVTLTGKHSGHSVVRGNDEAAVRGNVWSHQAMLDDAGLEGQRPMPADTRTLAHLMQDAGYTTGIIGKWGLGYPGSVATPNKMGFDYFFGYNCQRQAHTYYPMFLYENDKRVYLDNAPLLDPNARLDKDADPYAEASYDKFLRKDYSNDLMFEKTMSFIQENKDKPFFFMWTTPLPHVSLQAPKKWVDYYQKKFNETEPYTGDKGYLPCRYPKATYAAMLSYFDEQIGQLIAQLKKDGIYDNTIIFFTSDNGPTFNGGSESPWFDSANPFRSDSGWGKCFLHEGGIRVPLIVSWPNKIKEARVSDHICASWDFMATLADITKTKAPADTDGISYLPELMGEEQATHKSLYWELGAQRAARMGKWKVYAKGNAKGDLFDIQLFNLEEDIQEQNDLAASNPEMLAIMTQVLKDSRTKPTPPVPVPVAEKK